MIRASLFLILFNVIPLSDAFILPSPQVAQRLPVVISQRLSRPTTTTTQLHDIQNIVGTTTDIFPSNIDIPNIPLGLIIAVGLEISARQAKTTIWNGAYPPSWNKVNIKEAVLFGTINTIDVSCRVYIGLVLVNLASNYIPSLSLLLQQQQGQQLPTFAITLTVWIALAASSIKNVLFLQLVSGETLGRVELYDRLLDFCIFLLTCIQIINILGLEQGDLEFMQASLDVGKILTLAISLASRTLAENIIGGITLKLYDGFDEGDTVWLEDRKMKGKVLSIGLTETEILGSDNLEIKIPNSQIGVQGISNLSRVNQSRVKQTLRFHFSDTKKLPKVLDAITGEIEKSCPKVIADGSKPLVAFLESYESDHVKATVTCHFDDVSPQSSEYRVCRQEVIFAISRALDANEVELALPVA
mmetsp:Transcript_10786/g.15978  ORF Transcript_10786/g.15978 Transcript_10786/m.15978 type:complete len:415 (+) Transcript_10786:207-1451(+)